MSVPEQPDAELGTAVRALPAPEHRDGFAAELRALVLAEAAREAAHGQARERGGAEVVPLAPRRRWKRQALRVVTIAAAVAIVAVAAGIGLGGSGGGGGPLRTGVASASEVISRAEQALADVRTLQGTVSVREPAGSPRQEPFARTYRFAIDDEGSFRLRAVAPPELVEVRVYDADTATQTTYVDLPEEEPFATVRTGLAPAGPDPHPTLPVLRQRLGSTVRALRAAGEADVRETSYDGRPAWLLDADVEPNRVASGDGDHLAVTVDRASGLPVRVVEGRNGEPIRTVAMRDISQRSAPLDAADLRVEIPASVEVRRVDAGFRPVSLAEAGSAAEVAEVVEVAGYEPLVPATLPDGFRRDVVAVAEESGPTGKEGMNPVSVGVVSLSYSRGLDRLTVTTRRAENPGDWTDPLSVGEGYLADPRPFTVSGGALAGATAELLLDPRGVPHVWTVSDGLVVTVAGDATGDELRSVLASLRRRGSTPSSAVPASADGETADAGQFLAIGGGAGSGWRVATRSPSRSGDTATTTSSPSRTSPASSSRAN